jgi:histidine decarboxylase
MSPKKIDPFKKLNDLYRKFQKASKELAGYPASHFFDYSKLYKFLKFHINNIGDPFLKSGYYKINTLEIEREVIDGFAKLFHAPEDSYWGYVTNGGTEGNLYGLYVARELHPDGVVFFSGDTHYSVIKNLRILNVKAVKIKSLACGEIDYQELQKELTKCKNPPIIFANIGTTMKGAVDDVVRIKEILTDLKVKSYYIHCDAAFFGMILPFLPEQESQKFDFRLGVDSIAISGHKMIGTPFPCGVVLTKKNHVKQMGNHIDYIGSSDSTITGSRNGVSPLLLWHELKCAQEGKLKKLVENCIERAGYAVKKFNEENISAWRNKNSIIVVFPRPSEKTCKKWQLACEGPIAHMITLPHVPYKLIDRIVKDVVSDVKKGKRQKNAALAHIP